jgi:hypothetical protein
MALTVTYEESYPDSRSMSIGTDNYDLTYKFYLCGNFYDEAIVDEDYPDLIGKQDEQQVVLSLYSILPNFRYVPLANGLQARLVIKNMQIDQSTTNSWIVTVQYSMPDPGEDPNGISADPEAGQWSNEYVQIGFNVIAEQETVKTSLATTIDMRVGSGDDPIPSSAVKYNIGETADGVEGVATYVRKFGFNITQFFSPERLTYAYTRRLYRMATMLNNDVFFGFPRLSVLFLNSNASSDLYNKVPVTFEFEVRPNFKFSQTGPTKLCPPEEDDPAKMFDVYKDEYFEDSPSLPGTTVHSGWDEVEYRYYEATTADEKNKYTKPRMRLVHKMYEPTDFSKFEL